GPLWLLPATLLPALLWYAHAASLVGQGGGSRASADNGGIWLAALVPTALLRPETYAHVGRFLLVRAFTPIGPVLALVGFIAFRSEDDRLWRVWGLSVLGAMALVAAKLHHEYYWLSLAPVMAVGVARAVVGLAGLGLVGKLSAGLAAGGLAALSAAF